MHDRRIRSTENRPHFDDAIRKPDQLAYFLAPVLNRGAGFETLPAATRKKDALEFDRRCAEPAATGQDAQTLILIHVQALLTAYFKFQGSVKYTKLGNIKMPVMIAFPRNRANQEDEREE
jgi:hypothetical protein